MSFELELNEGVHKRMRELYHETTRLGPDVLFFGVADDRFEIHGRRFLEHLNKAEESRMKITNERGSLIQRVSKGPADVKISRINAGGKEIISVSAPFIARMGNSSLAGLIHYTRSLNDEMIEQILAPMLRDGRPELLIGEGHYLETGGADTNKRIIMRFRRIGEGVDLNYKNEIEDVAGRETYERRDKEIEELLNSPQFKRILEILGEIMKEKGILEIISRRENNDRVKGVVVTVGGMVMEADQFTGRSITTHMKLERMPENEHVEVGKIIGRLVEAVHEGRKEDLEEALEELEGLGRG